MRAVVFTGDRTLDIIDRPDPTPDVGEVVLEIKASGMCGSDLHMYRAPRREQLRIAGHEPCGVVAELGVGVRGVAVGDRVMVHHYDGCGTCANCTGGWTQMCVRGPVVYGGPNGDGAHAHYMTVPAHTLVALPDELSFTVGSALACGTGTAYGALKQLDLAGNETVVVFGQGPVGLSATTLAKHLGARVVALDVQAERRDLARDFGADVVLDPTTDDVVAAVRDVTGGLGAHKSLDCSSHPDARRQSLEVLRQWGTACLVGLGAGMEVSPDLMILRQLRLIGSWTFSKAGLADCARFVVERGIDVEGLFTHRFELDQAEEAYQLFDAQKMGKGVFVF